MLLSTLFITAETVRTPFVAKRVLLKLNTEDYYSDSDDPDYDTVGDHLPPTSSPLSSNVVPGRTADVTSGSDPTPSPSSSSSTEVSGRMEETSEGSAVGHGARVNDLEKRIRELEAKIDEEEIYDDMEDDMEDTPAEKRRKEAEKRRKEDQQKQRKNELTQLKQQHRLQVDYTYDSMESETTSDAQRSTRGEMQNSGGAQRPQVTNTSGLSLEQNPRRDEETYVIGTEDDEGTYEIGTEAVEGTYLSGDEGDEVPDRMDFETYGADDVYGTYV